MGDLFLVKRNGRWIADVNENGYEYSDDIDDALIYSKSGGWLEEWQSINGVEIVPITIELIRGDS